MCLPLLLPDILNQRPFPGPIVRPEQISATLSKDLFNIRMTEHKDYFASHTKIQGVYNFYNFMKKNVDNLPS